VHDHPLLDPEETDICDLHVLVLEAELRETADEPGVSRMITFPHPTSARLDG
jgi:hypothetical protein